MHYYRRYAMYKRRKQRESEELEKNIVQVDIKARTRERILPRKRKTEYKRNNFVSNDDYMFVD